MTLEDVRMDVGKQLLDIDSVKEFIAQVAPVPFSHLKFKLGKGIIEEAQKAAGVYPDMLRLSVGLEHLDDIKDDILQALRK